MATLVMQISGGAHGAEPIRIRVDGKTRSHMKLVTANDTTRHGTQKYAFCEILQLMNIADFFKVGTFQRNNIKRSINTCAGRMVFGVVMRIGL